jgi:asparagine synthase (glutamine-hydrolysing)
MCGIAGILSTQAPRENPATLVRAMTDAIAHRGPDGEGSFVDRDGRVALGHRRLAVVDLAETGRQPMVSASGRYVVTFNGEIYNFRELRRELEQLQCRFRGTSDTEVMLAGFDVWGVRQTLRRLNGMFAFAVWDKADATFTLARDRLGEKPLYYWMDGQRLVFASELKALMQCPFVPCRVDRDSLCAYFRFSYIPAPRTIFADVHKLDAASLMIVQFAEGALRATTQKYWVATELFAGSKSLRAAPLAWNETVDAAQNLFADAVRMRMVADVPLGAFLSGGIDSSTVVALMQANSTRPVRTFTVSFAEFGFNEAPYAQAVARHLGTEHTEIPVSARDALDRVPSLCEIYDEPFGDSSQIPMLLVSHVARQKVTVALSGDGADEVFGGYSRYVWWRRFWRMSRALPPAVLAVLVSLMRSAGYAYGNGRPLAQFLLSGRAAAMGDLAERALKAADVLAQQSLREVFLRMISQAVSPTDLVLRGREPASLISSWTYAREEDAFTEDMMLMDLLTYLPDDIMVKVDRASMACSLESRAPFLDPRIVEFSWQLPLSTKIQDQTGKRLVREILYRHLPRELFDRPKQGFGVPIAQWLRGPLREWAGSLLEPARLRAQQLLNADLVERCWNDLQSGRRLHPHHVWNILMLQAWLERWQTRVSI